MAFVRKKTVRGQQYHYLCESRWEDGKPRQKVVAYLGEYATVKAALSHWKRETTKAPDAEGRKHAREMVKKLKEYHKEAR
jgi:hypothetical protein